MLRSFENLVDIVDVSLFEAFDTRQEGPVANLAGAHVASGFSAMYDVCTDIPRRRRTIPPPTPTGRGTE